MNRMLRMLRALVAAHRTQALGAPRKNLVVLTREPRLRDGSDCIRGPLIEAPSANQIEIAAHAERLAAISDSTQALRAAQAELGVNLRIAGTIAWIGLAAAERFETQPVQSAQYWATRIDARHGDNLGSVHGLPTVPVNVMGSGAVARQSGPEFLRA